MARAKKIGPPRSKSDMNNYYNNYIACFDLDFSWKEKQVKRVTAYWNSGYHIAEIAKKVNRIIDEVTILIIDLSRKGKIEERKGGVFGVEVS